MRPGLGTKVVNLAKSNRGRAVLKKGQSFSFTSPPTQVELTGAIDKLGGGMIVGRTVLKQATKLGRSFSFFLRFTSSLTVLLLPCEQGFHLKFKLCAFTESVPDSVVYEY